MGERTEYKAGTFCWPELATSDQEGAKKFYGSLFGWSIFDMPMSVGGTYTMFLYKEKSVGAVYKMMDEQASQGVPPNWLSYVSVDSVDDSAAKAQTLGATLISEPFDAEDAGAYGYIK